jgi:hypothetical protein
LNTTVWFFPQWLGLMLFITVLAVSGFYVSRGGEAVFGKRLLD